jgi:inositol 1,4,5-triphosphate receptor type 1
LGTNLAGADDQAYPPLRLGDEILLFCQEKRGYAFSDVSSKIVHSVAACPVIHPFSKEDPNLPDTLGGCFKVLAANKYRAQEKLASLREELKDKKRLGQNERELLRIAERNAQSELEENNVEQERLKGSPVAYGISVQLQHVYTGKYVSVNPTSTSSLESTNLRMELRAENSQNCILRILPRYKVRSVGDEVLINDQVIFESLETKGQYLHCSRRTLGTTGSHLHSKYNELNLSGTESSFTVVSHRHVQDAPQNPDTLWAGGVFRLFHREIECYLVAEGSFVELDEDSDRVTKDVHLRKRPSERGQLKAPSSSAITYWRIEKQRNPISGEAMQWGELCRIRHLVTRQYLAIENTKEGIKVCLKDYQKGSDTEPAVTFRLRPVIQGEESITYGSFARFYHPKTETWLHAMKEVKRDGGDLFKISAESDMSYVDAFSLMKVSDDLVRQFNAVAGMMPIFEAYLNERQVGERKLTKVKASVMEQVRIEFTIVIRWTVQG